MLRSRNFISNFNELQLKKAIEDFDTSVRKKLNCVLFSSGNKQALLNGHAQIYATQLISSSVSWSSIENRVSNTSVPNLKTFETVQGVLGISSKMRMTKALR